MSFKAVIVSLESYFMIFPSNYFRILLPAATVCLIGIAALSCSKASEPLVEKGDLPGAMPLTRTPLDFSMRAPFRNEHGYTHYFPAETWEPSIEAFGARLGEAPAREAHEPKLFADLASQMEHVDNIPERLKQVVLQRANDYLNPASDSFIHFDNLSHGRSSISGPAFVRILNHELLDLLVAWKLTGEERYRDASIEFVASLMRVFPLAGFPDSTAAFSADIYGGAMNPHGASELIKPLAIAYDLLRGEMEPSSHRALAQRLRDYIEIQLQRTRSSIAIQGPDRARSNWWVPYHNWTAMVCGSMGLAALAIEGDLDDFDPMPALWTAYSSLQMWLDKSFEPEGAYLEGNHYTKLGLGNSTPFFKALALRGGPNLLQHPHLSKSLHYVASELLPEPPPMRLNAWNRSNYMPLRWDYFVLVLARALEQPVGLWIWENAGETDRLHPLGVLYYPHEMKAERPENAGVDKEMFFLRRGLVNLRSGWGRDDFFFAFSSGPLFPTIHGQSDENTFHLYAYGNMFAVDSGAGGYGTETKSGILINARGQAQSGGSRSVDGFIPAYGQGPAYTYIMGDAKSAYDQNNHGHPGVGVGRADRHVLYVKGNTHSDSSMKEAPPYIVIFDDIQHNEDVNTYSWLLQSAPGNFYDLAGLADRDAKSDGFSISVWGANGKANMKVHFLNPDNFDVKTDIMQGNQRLNVSTRAVNPNFLSILFPYRIEWEDNLPTMRRFYGDGFAGGVLQAETFTDVIACSWSGPIANEGIESDAQMLHLRKDASGKPVHWMVIGATYLKVDGELLLQNPESTGVQFYSNRKFPIQLNEEHARSQ
jgi:hypothetical protein